MLSVTLFSGTGLGPPHGDVAFQAFAVQPLVIYPDAIVRADRLTAKCAGREPFRMALSLFLAHFAPPCIIR